MAADVFALLATAREQRRAGRRGKSEDFVKFHRGMSREDRCASPALSERVLDDLHAVVLLVDGAFVLDRVDGGAPVAVLRAVRLVDLRLEGRRELVATVQLRIQ